MNVSDILFSLVRLGLGGDAAAGLGGGAADQGCGALRADAPVDVRLLFDTAYRQHVGAVSEDGLERLPGGALDAVFSQDNAAVRYEWFGAVLSCEGAFARYSKRLAGLVRYLTEGGAGRIMLLKGYGCALDYPVPGHRTMGDADIFSLDGKSEEVDRLLSAFPGYAPRRSGFDRHSHASFKGMSVENHFRFTSGGRFDRRYAALERALMDELAGARPVDVGGCEVYLPSATFNAMFLMWHLAAHMRLETVNLRQLCDWWMFLRGHSAEVDWALVSRVWRSARLERLAAAVNGLLVSRLGMDASLVPPFVRSAGDEARLEDFVFNAEPLEVAGVEAVLKYFRRRWNFALVGDCWLAALLRSVASHAHRG